MFSADFAYITLCSTWYHIMHCWQIRTVYMQFGK